jgi:hypothetical protein
LVVSKKEQEKGIAPEPPMVVVGRRTSVLVVAALLEPEGSLHLSLA